MVYATAYYDMSGLDSYEVTTILSANIIVYHAILYMILCYTSV